MDINNIIHGFVVNRIRPLNELNAEFIEMTHIKTGLELVWIKRDEENKTFGIAFETLPFDDTGVFHILEHSVLCGSDKYPVKEPFVELLKTSMNTFLNAMTFPDKTFYPISSRNDKDYFNLMRVYLDAVFRPLIYSKPEIFYQEGWHYEFDENDNVSYKGVVFNEMKGVFAGADELEEMALNRALFPDSPYKYVSGGDPSCIPDLTYESFVDSHRKFYSPSNGYVFLDGNINIDETLRIINEEYLSSYDKSERLAPPVMQEAVDGGVTEMEYELGDDENLENRTRIAWGGVIGSFADRERLVAMQILSDVLCGSNQSLLSKSVITEGLAEDVIMQLYDGVAQPWLKLELQNVADDKVNEIEEIVFSKLAEIAENGIDPSQLEATMANIEFQMRERDYGNMPQGLVFGFITLENWLYGGDPIGNLEVGDLFVRLKEKMKDGYFEQLLKELVLDNQHKATVILKPSHSAGEDRRKREQKRIENEISLWDDSTLSQMKAKQAALSVWQNSEDSYEQLATLPQLALSDISPKPEDLPTEVMSFSGITSIYHDINCSGIVNLNLYFDAEDLDETEISELSFLTDILSKVRTLNYSEEELDRINRLLFGSLDFSVSAHPDKVRNDTCKVKMAVSFGTLESNVDKTLDFVAELLNNTQFDSESTAHEILRQLKTKYYQQIVMSGASIGMGRISAMNNSFGVVNDCAGGYEYYKWLSEQDDSWNWTELSNKLKLLIDKLVCAERLTISLTGGNKEILGNVSNYFAANLKSSETVAVLGSSIKPWGNSKEGIAIPADISFACAGGLLPDGQEYNGSMAIASKIISLAYLWNVIRVQGGAYGTGFNISRNRMSVCYSYRDPNAPDSLECYKSIPDFLDEFCNSNDDITGFIIGSIAAASPLLTPKMRGSVADKNYWSGITYQDREQFLKEMLEADIETVSAISEEIRYSLDNCGICVIGEKSKLASCGLDDIYNL